MGKKLSVSIGAMALIAMFVAPMATAHLTADSLTLAGPLSYDGTTDKCRSAGSPGGACPENNRVSGTYRGATSFWVGSDQFPLVVPIGLGEPLPDQIQICVGDDTDQGNNRYCNIDFGGQGCDTEWLVAGTFEGNEMVVEGDKGNVNGGGSLPDGLWDDGGDGAACHVNNGPGDGGPAGTSWNTYGCGTTARGKDANPLVGSNVWLSNECDYLVAVVVGGGLFDCVVNQFVLGDDGVSGVIGGAQTPEGAVAYLVDTCVPMVVPFVTGIVDGATGAGDPAPVETVCGQNAGTDDFNFGTGGAGVPAVALGSDSDGNACATTDANQWVFVHHMVDVNLDSESSVALPATMGWID